MPLIRCLSGVLALVALFGLTACGGGGGRSGNPPPNAATFTVGGVVTGLRGSGLRLLNNGGSALAISANGGFTFTVPVANGSAYSVTVGAQPTSPVQTCTVANGSGTISANVTNITVTCSTQTFTVGGTVTGLAGSGLRLQNNGADALAIASNGAFVFTTPIAASSAYNVTVSAQPDNPAQTCVVANGSGTLGAMVANVAVTCATSTFTVGATITGLRGTGLVLSNNDTDTLRINADGDYEFSTVITSGGTYDIAIDTVPRTPVQRCTVFSGSGTVTNANVIANISCVDANPTFVYGLNRAKGTLSTYAVDSTSGQLLPRSYAATRDGPTAAVTFKARNGNEFTYVLNRDFESISGYSANIRTGELAELAGSSFPVSNHLGAQPDTLTLHPSRPFIYTVNTASNEIAGFAIDEDSGELTWVPNGPVATGDDPRSFTVDPTGRFAYVAVLGSAALYTYAIDQTTGALSEVPDSRRGSGTDIGGIFLDRNGRFLYVINTPGSVSGYSIDAATGVLTQMAGNAWGTPANSVLAGVHPNGKFVYLKHPFSGATTGNGLSAFVIDAATGALTRVAGSPFDSGANPGAVAFDPSGKYLYVGHSAPAGTTFQIRAYEVDAVTGALTAVTGGPVATNQFPSSLDVDPSGKYLYARNQSSNQVSSYEIDPGTGALTAVAYSPSNVGEQPSFISVAEDTAPLSFVSKFTYIVDHDFDQLHAFAIDADTGVLNPVGGTLTVGGFANGATIDPKNRFAYVPSAVSGWVHAYRIDATSGALTEIAGSPFPAGDDPVAVAVDPSGRFAFVAELGGGLIRRFLINQTTGALASPLAFAAAGEPLNLASHPNGEHLYALAQTNGEILIYDIESSEGNLTPSQTAASVDAGNQPVAMAIHPGGKYAYVTDANTDQVLAYSIDSLSGVLSPMGSYNTNGDAPLGIVMDRTGTFLFVANFSSDEVSLFLIREDGSLLGGVTYDVGDGPSSLAMDYDGRYLRVGHHHANTIETYLFNRDDATLTLVGTANVPAGIGSGSLATSSHTQ
jgi:6-phosphogluconolactonase (cycloisomerase 2 family)